MRRAFSEELRDKDSNLDHLIQSHNRPQFRVPLIVPKMRREQGLNAPVSLQLCWVRVG